MAKNHIHLSLYKGCFVTCENEEDLFNNEDAHFSHCNYMQISPDPQGQLTPRSKVGSA